MCIRDSPHAVHLHRHWHDLRPLRRPRHRRSTGRARRHRSRGHARGRPHGRHLRGARRLRRGQGSRCRGRGVRGRPGLMPTTVSTHPDARESIVLDVTGMTCASCAARIEKKLGKVDGVSASVNYATNKALVLAPAGMAVADLIKTVESAGYGASVPEPDAPPPPDPAELLRRRVTVSAILAVPVILLGMIPALHFPGWQWVSLVLATPVVAWAGWPFHRSAWVNLRHGATTMDTLVSVGTIAAYLQSVYALVWGSAGRIGFTHQIEFRLTRGMAGGAVYFEAAVGIVTFILLGRYFEARARRSAGHSA